MPLNHGHPLPPSRRRLGSRQNKIPGVIARRNQEQRLGNITDLDETQDAPRIRRNQRRNYRTRHQRNILSLIQQYARARRTVVITYLKVTTGEVVTREIEPYSIRFKMTRNGRRRYLYGSCGTHGGQIHSFIIENIQQVRGTSNRFAPRWEVEF